MVGWLFGHGGEQSELFGGVGRVFRVRMPSLFVADG